MSFSSVFKSLQELFPQVDRRMLRAVAIEHTDDVNAAVDFILNEVLSTVSTSACQIEEKSLPLEHQEVVNNANSVTSDSNEHTNDSHTPKNLSNFDKPCASLKTEEHQVSNAVSTSLVNDNNIFFDCNNVDHDLNEPVALGTYKTVSSERILVEPCSTANLENVVVQHDSLPVCNGVDEEASESQISSDDSKKPETSCSQESSSELVPEYSSDGSKKPEASCSLKTSSSELVPDSEVADFEDESFPSTATTQSGHICRIDVLEDAINEAKNNKKTLFSSMESVITMMREVEDLEKAAEHTKEEAVKGGLDILAKVEEIRQMLLHAKEANDMHAGEVYGEKSILATEARELQSRLVNLFNERDRSLGILDEMRQALEARMKAAEEVKRGAEHDRLEKECSAKKALSEQELVMDKVVQESKRLQSEAEENSKLREFLMDRGKVVDILHGEMSVICQDVKSLKENFDERVPLSKSLSSSHTSCILASSGSSGKSVASSLVPEQVESSEGLQMGNRESEQVESSEGLEMGNRESVEDLPETSRPLITEGGEKKLTDDDWELCEDDSELYNLCP